ncbi:MAG TPA: GNAT family N-acetyltransferase [Candidatus Binatia bacterium]|jgi:CelD/BcsL family acetyltransferase involved in cellulose biosynthesis
MIEVVSDAAGFEKLRDEWSELLEASSADCIFLTWEWLFTWWKHLSTGRKLSILTVRRGHELIALAPLAVQPAGLRPFSLVRCVEFLGTGEVGSDYLDLIAKRGDEPEALRALAEYLAETKPMLRMDHLKRQSCSANEVARRLKERGWDSHDAKRSVAPFIDLAGHSWDSFLATLGSEHRYNFKRRLKNLTKHFAVRFEPANSEEERRRALALLVELHGMRWQSNGSCGSFQDRSILSFHEEISRVALERGWLRLFVLWLDQKPAAALYAFRYRRVFYFYQSGFDPVYGKFSVGLVAMGLAIKSALEEGAEEYDLLYGDEAYKFLWARQARELGRLEVYPPNAVGRIYRQAVEVNRAARKVARQVLLQPASPIKS